MTGAMEPDDEHVPLRRRGDVNEWQRQVAGDPAMTGLPSRLALTLGSLVCHTRGYAFPTQAQLMAELGASRSSIQRAVRRMKEAGHLTVRTSYGRGLATEYFPVLKRVARPEKRCHLLGPFSPAQDPKKGVILGDTPQEYILRSRDSGTAVAPDAIFLPNEISRPIDKPNPAVEPQAEAGAGAKRQARRPKAEAVPACHESSPDVCDALSGPVCGTVLAASTRGPGSFAIDEEGDRGTVGAQAPSVQPAEPPTSEFNQQGLFGDLPDSTRFDPETLARTLREGRERAGLTQSAFGARLGIKQSHVANCERAHDRLSSVRARYALHLLNGG